MSPVLNWLPTAVRVCVTESLFVTVTVDPGATDTLMGENMKFEMVMEFVDVAVPDPSEVDEPEFPPLQADRSSAPARTRTSAPPLYRRIGSRIAQTAMEVGLNASGVPEGVC